MLLAGLLAGTPPIGTPAPSTAPELDVKAENGKTEMTLGLALAFPIDSAHKILVTPSVKVPLIKDSDPPRAELEDLGVGWRGSLGITYQSDTLLLPRAAPEMWRFTGKVEYGASTYKYFPDGTVDEEAVVGHSFATEVIILHWYRQQLPFTSGSSRWAPQVRFRYDRGYKSKEQSIAGPELAGTAPIVRTVAITAPTVAPKFNVRGFLPMQLPDWLADLNVGPALHYEFAGPQDGFLPDASGDQQVRGEMWFQYYIPQLPNTRIGLAPYASRTFESKGETKDSFGFVVELRSSIAGYEY